LPYLNLHKMKKFIKNLFELMWTIWCFLIVIFLFFTYIPFAFIVVNLRNKKLIHKIELLTHRMAGLVMILWGIIPVYKNRHLINFKKHQIYVGNHRSYLDAFMAVYGIKSYKKFIGMHKVFDWFLIGYFAKKFNHVPVERESEEKRDKSFDTIFKEAQSGNSICFFPEGRIVMTDDLIHDFWNGAFRIAIELEIPIVPFTLIDTGRLFPPNRLRIKPGLSRCFWHQPISTIGMTIDDLPKLKAKAQNIIHSKLSEFFPSGKYPIDYNPLKWKYNGFYYEKRKN